MTNKTVERDERTTFVENIGYKYGYSFIAFALLLDVAYRSFRLGEASWDLLGIIVLSGLVMAVYKYQQGILGKSWTKIIALAFATAAIAGLLITLIVNFA